MTTLVAIGTREAPIILDDDDDDDIIFMAGSSRLPLRTVRLTPGQSQPTVVSTTSSSGGRVIDCIIIDDDLQDSSEPKLLPERTTESPPYSVQLGEPSGCPSPSEIASSHIIQRPSPVPPVLKRKRDSVDVGDDARSRLASLPYHPSSSMTSDPFAGLSKKQRKRLRKRIRNHQQEATQVDSTNASQISFPIPTFPSPFAPVFLPTPGSAHLGGLTPVPLSPLIPISLKAGGTTAHDAGSERAFSGPNWPDHLMKETATPAPNPGIAPMAYGGSVRHPLPMKPGSGMPPNAYGPSYHVIGKPVHADAQSGTYTKHRFIVDVPANTIVLENLPRKFRTLYFVLQWCRDVSLPDDPAPLHVAVDDRRAKALVEFVSRDQAKRAFHSPKLINGDGRAQICAFWLRSGSDSPDTSSVSSTVPVKLTCRETSRTSEAILLSNPLISTQSSAVTLALRDMGALLLRRHSPTHSLLSAIPSSSYSVSQKCTQAPITAKLPRDNALRPPVVSGTLGRRNVPVTEVEGGGRLDALDVDMEEGQIEEFQRIKDHHELHENLVSIEHSSYPPNLATGQLESHRSPPTLTYSPRAPVQDQQSEFEEGVEVTSTHQLKTSGAFQRSFTPAPPGQNLDARACHVDDSESALLLEDDSELMYPLSDEEECGSPGASDNGMAPQSLRPSPSAVAFSGSVAQDDSNSGRFPAAAVEEVKEDPATQTFPVNNPDGIVHSDTQDIQCIPDTGLQLKPSSKKDTCSPAATEKSRRNSKDRLRRAQNNSGNAGAVMDIDTPVSKLPSLGSLRHSPLPISPASSRSTTGPEDPVREDGKLSPPKAEKHISASTDQLPEIEDGEVIVCTDPESKPQTVPEHRLAELRKLVLASKKRKVPAPGNTLACSAACKAASDVSYGSSVVVDVKTASSNDPSQSSSASESSSNSSSHLPSPTLTPATSISSTGGSGVPKSTSFFDRMATAFLEDLLGPSNSGPHLLSNAIGTSNFSPKDLKALLQEKQRRLDGYLAKSKLLLSQWEAASGKSEKARVMKLIKEEKRLFESEEAAADAVLKEIESGKRGALSVKPGMALKKSSFRRWPQTRLDQMVLTISDSEDDSEDVSHAGRSDE